METAGKGSKVRGVVNCIAFIGFVCAMMYAATLMVMHIADAVFAGVKL